MNRFRGRRRLLALVLLAISASGPPARAATTGVDEVGTSFNPAQVDIAVGDRVVWTNRSNDFHTVTFERGPDLHPNCDPILLGFGCQGPGSTVERTFIASGTYPYYCKLHRNTMRGVVVVTAAAASTTAAPTTSSTLPRATTSSSTARPSSTSTTATTRPLATSSTIGTSSTSSSTTEPSAVLMPGDPPAVGDDTNSSAAGTGGSDKGSGTGTVALIVALLLAVSAVGGYLLWRLRPGRA